MQLELDFGIEADIVCNCRVYTYIDRWEKRDGVWLSIRERCDCEWCGARHDRRRPEKMIQDRVEALRKAKGYSR